MLHMSYNYQMAVSKNMGKPPKSSILIGFSIINHPFWGTIIFGKTQMLVSDGFGGEAHQNFCKQTHDTKRDGVGQELRVFSKTGDGKKTRILRQSTSSDNAM